MTIKVFVSHAHCDEPIAEEFVNCLCLATSLTREEIRCTSVFGADLDAADDVAVLRDDVTQAEAVVCIVTPESLRSAWAMAELGAAWQANKWTALLRVGVRPEDMEGPMATRNTRDATDVTRFTTTIEELANEVGVDVRTGSILLGHAKGFAASCERHVDQKQPDADRTSRGWGRMAVVAIAGAVCGAGVAAGVWALAGSSSPEARNTLSGWYVAEQTHAKRVGDLAVLDQFQALLFVMPGAKANNLWLIEISINGIFGVDDTGSRGPLFCQYVVRWDWEGEYAEADQAIRARGRPVDVRAGLDACIRSLPEKTAKSVEQVKDAYVGRFTRGECTIRSSDIGRTGSRLDFLCRYFHRTGEPTGQLKFAFRREPH